MSAQTGSALATAGALLVLAIREPSTLELYPTMDALTADERAGLADCLSMLRDALIASVGAAPEAEPAGM